MNHLFSLAFIGTYSAAIIQLSFLVFSDVLDDGVLTYVAVGIGLLVAPLLRLYQKWRHDKLANFIIEYKSDSTPFHHKILNIPAIVVLTTMGSMGFIAVTNHKFSSNEVTHKEFRVTGVGQQRVRYDLFEYVRISDGISETSYSLGTATINPYKVGDQLKIKLRAGLWGYDIVDEIKKSTNKASKSDS
ncbi:hypothetical protein CWB77_06620 [Pseudoalteromonas sp. S1610]|uniref:hypothetical protein n=1 Tax=Pseudoalteromonas sp. S1610 TaxID=579506 RepID=UPI00110A9C53|nr:hypothetical protein [Pseudoalteromonas sp. S1610]TMP62452.1 hypothetical protein CWB77_06620 [Pseudoalteromonas sp. S1610]